MNRALLLSLLATPVLVFAAACSGEDATPPPVGTGGFPTGGTGGSGTPIGGSGTPVGGMAPVGGMGPVAGTGGSTTAGTGGSTTAGTGGSTTAGTGGSATAGTGGTTTAGTGGSTTAGTGGATGGTGGGGAITIESLVGKLDGHLVVMPCGEMTPGDDCQSAGAIHNGMTKTCTVMGASSFLDHVVEYPIAGESGKTYNVTMHFYGIMEPKNYGTSGVMRVGGTTNTNIMTLMPLPWAQQMPPGAAYRPSNYNTYEIHVHNPAGAVVATYFINSDTGENHYTFAINYERTIPVIGGGKVRLRIFDANCRQIKNCTGGTSMPNSCSGMARSVNISAAMPQPPSGVLSQPGLGRETQNSGQWFLLDVKAVQPM